MNFSIEMNLDLKLISRSGYTSLDLISDIGGIQGILLSVFGVVLGVLNYNMLDNHLVTKLFKRLKKPNTNSNEVYDFKVSPCQNIKEYLHSICKGICKKCCSCYKD